VSQYNLQQTEGSFQQVHLNKISKKIGSGQVSWLTTKKSRTHTLEGSAFEVFYILAGIG